MQELLQNKKFFPFIVGGVLFLLLIIYIILSSAKPTTQLTTLPLPTPFEAPRVTFSPIVTITRPTEFSIIDVNPDIKQPITYQQHIIQVIFNQELDPKNVSFTLNPYNKIHTNVYKNSQGQYLLEVVPIDNWKNLTTYQLTINHTTKNKAGNLLGKDIIIKFDINTYPYKGI